MKTMQCLMLSSILLVGISAQASNENNVVLIPNIVKAELVNPKGKVNTDTYQELYNQYNSKSLSYVNSIVDENDRNDVNKAITIALSIDNKIPVTSDMNNRIKIIKINQYRRCLNLFGVKPYESSYSFQTKKSNEELRNELLLSFNQKNTVTNATDEHQGMSWEQIDSNMLEKKRKAIGATNLGWTLAKYRLIAAATTLTVLSVGFKAYTAYAKTK